LFVPRNKPVEDTFGVFCFGTKTWKKVVFVLDVFLFVCFECSPSRRWLATEVVYQR